VRHILILDDVRSITQATAILKGKFAIQKDDHFTLMRPFRHDGDKIINDLDDAFDTVILNPAFDVWILDNDLGPGVEGYDFLKSVSDQYPDKMPTQCFSCSSNFDRKRQIEGYFFNWSMARNDNSPVCDECCATIPVINGGGMANKYHRQSCSLYDAEKE
jgi:hypothetical protein